MRIVAKMTVAIEPTKTPTAFKMRATAILRSYNKNFFFTLKNCFSTAS